MIFDLEFLHFESRKTYFNFCVSDEVYRREFDSFVFCLLNKTYHYIHNQV